MYTILIVGQDTWVIAGVFESWSLCLETLAERLDLADDDYDLEENVDRLRMQNTVWTIQLHTAVTINTVPVQAIEIWEKPVNVFNVYNF